MYAACGREADPCISHQHQAGHMGEANVIAPSGFGRNVFPALLADGQLLFGYPLSEEKILVERYPGRS